MVTAFAEAMPSAGVEPTRLRALPYRGGGSMRTDVITVGQRLERFITELQQFGSQAVTLPWDSGKSGSTGRPTMTVRR